MRRILFALIVVCAAATPAYAYIGPGLGTGVVSTVLALLASFALAVFAIVWYPIKRLIKRLRGGWRGKAK